MSDPIKGSSVPGLEKALRDRQECPYVLRLYVAGLTPMSVRAIANTKRICEEHLPGRYMLHVIDVYQQPDATREFPLVAAPTLVKERPLPQQLLIGDMSRTAAVLAGLGIPPGDATEEGAS